MKTNYGRCPKKIEARDTTIVRAWRNLTGLQAIPQDQQYWTLPGPMFDGEGRLQPSCELNHVLGAGLVHRADQFYGAEIDQAVHAGNVKAVAHMKPGPHLSQGDIFRVMEATLSDENLRPAIVNLDTLSEPRRAARLLGQVAHLLNHVPGVKMVVLNAVVDAPRWGRRYGLNAIVEAIKQDPFCQHQLDYEWKQSIEGWVYNGTGKTSIKMGTLVFFQPYPEVAIAC